MKLIRILIVAVSTIFFIGCEGVGIVSSNNPLVKLSQAQELYNNQGRALPAERLIQQAITLCKKKKDNICLAKSYIEYGFFFRSPTLKKFHVTYEKNGFLDKTVVFKDRYYASLKYFKKSVKILSNTKEYGLLTNAYLNLGFTYRILKKSKLECSAYNKSILFNKINLDKNPEVKISLPQGVSSFKEYVSIWKKRANCR